MSQSGAPTGDAEETTDTGTKAYTRRGDAGFTGLLGPGRVPKYDRRIEAFGTLDEATSAMGLARALGSNERVRQVILDGQRQLYLLMAELARPRERPGKDDPMITAAHVQALEALINDLEAEAPMPQHFVIPGDTVVSAALDVARTVVRRAEREATRLVHEGQIQNEQVLAFLNRFSSLLFVLARYEEQVEGAGYTLVARGGQANETRIIKE